MNCFYSIFINAILYIVYENTCYTHALGRRDTYISFNATHYIRRGVLNISIFVIEK
jgi:hypothetical protein